MPRFVALSVLGGLIAVQATSASAADIFRYADTVVAYNPGAAADSHYVSDGVEVFPPNFFTDPSRALGVPSTLHTPTIMANVDGSGEPTVVSLGQGGSITLGFNSPVRNQGPSVQNPYGYDLLVWGNAFQNGSVITAEFDYGRFQEPAFVEVAQTNAAGQPIEWFLILPRIFYESAHLRGLPGRGVTPRDFTIDQLVQPTPGAHEWDEWTSGDVDRSASRFDGLADVTPMSGSTLAGLIASGDIGGIVLDDPATYAIEGLGGGGIDLSRAVRQSSPGVPLLGPTGEFQFVPLTQIDLIRLTDAVPNDIGETAAVTADIDGLIVLPNMDPTPTPEPATLALVLTGAAGLVWTRRRSLRRR